MSIYDDQTIEKNVAEHNEIYKSGVTPTRKDIRWTSTERRQRDKDMKQFCKSSGESGIDPYFVVNDAYREGWERIFGRAQDEDGLSVWLPEPINVDEQHVCKHVWNGGPYCSKCGLIQFDRVGR